MYRILLSVLIITSLCQSQSIAPKNKWIDRSYHIGKRFYQVYTPGWEGANGAIGDAYLFRATNDSSLLNRYRYQFDLLKMFNGTWVDDRAWICLAELYWWEFSGKKDLVWVEDAKKRYIEARKEGRLTKHEGFWSWYNYPPDWNTGEQLITNSNMNQLVSVACKLFEATGDRRFLDEALKVWNGDKSTPGIEKTYYAGNGIWKGKGGAAAFGKQLPWESASYLSVLASLYKVTKDSKYKTIAIASAKHIVDPNTKWLHPTDYYQIHMDGNGAFVHYLLDAYEIAPEELSTIPGIVEKMLEHVWTNNHGQAAVMLHREYDHSIRNGWNPNGGEDGYGVNEIGTVHAQSQALRAFAVFAYFTSKANH
ncbi:MAG: glycoside hydrolase family 76 protein [Bacteriovoracaceae bacterium]|nr:hypothetical protein [Bacteroidota bacterium]